MPWAVTFYKNVPMFFFNQCITLYSWSLTSSFNNLSRHHQLFLKLGHLITAYLPILNSLLLCRWSAFHSFKQTGPMMQHRRFVLTLQQLPSNRHRHILNNPLFSSNWSCTSRQWNGLSTPDMSYLHTVLFHWLLQYSLTSCTCENVKTINL